MADSPRARRHLRRMRLFALAALALTLASMVGIARSPVARALDRDERVAVLAFGVDAADLSRHTDTLMLAVYDPKENYLGVLNVPRDTRISLPGYRFRRVNEIYGYHLRRTRDRRRAADEVRAGVAHLLSSEEAAVAVPYHIQVDFNGFRRMVDLLGGVWVNVKVPMHYDDDAGNLHIHFEPGRQLIKGDRALEYVRFRGATGDRGRIYRQQEFLRNMLRRLANPMMIFRVPQIAAVIVSSVDSNLAFSDLLALCVAARRIRPENVGFYILPGKPRGALWIPNRALASRIASMIVAGNPPIEETPDIAPQSDRITIKVWNAAGRTGLAYKTTRFLRRSGFDVVDWGNYPAVQTQTRVIGRKGDIGSARQVAERLGIDSYHSEPVRRAYVDVEVVLGTNFAGLASDAR